jgi:ribonuclease BN (tRNA processing enzyme)
MSLEEALLRRGRRGRADQRGRCCGVQRARRQDAVFKRAATAVLGQTPEPLDGLRVIVCGSASPLGRSPERAQACIAVVTAEHFLLFNVGARSPLRMTQARLPMARINGVFLTHFHSDHIAALPDVNLASWVQGRPAPLDVYGPPGVQSVVDGFNAADGLFAAAQGADLLLHDALSRTLLDPMIEVATDLGLPSSEIMIDVIDYHADVTSLPTRAAAAGIKLLALYHLVPAPPNALIERMFLRGLPDDVILTHDLHTFDLPAGSSEIRIREP